MKQEEAHPGAQDLSHFGGSELDTNYDYEQAAARRTQNKEHLSPSPVDGLRLIGRVAQIFTDGKKVQERLDKVATWWKGKRAQWREEKSHRKEDLAYRGSLAEISDATIPYEEAHEWRQKGSVAQPVPDKPGVYQSNFSEPAEQAPASHQTENMDDIWDAAVQRARASLGKLPVLHSAPPVVPGRPEVAEREKLIERLENAYGQPAIEPDRSNHVGKHRPQEDGDQLVTTNGK